MANNVKIEYCVKDLYKVLSNGKKVKCPDPRFDIEPGRGVFVNCNKEGKHGCECWTIQYNPFESDRTFRLISQCGDCDNCSDFRDVILCQDDSDCSSLGCSKCENGICVSSCSEGEVCVDDEVCKPSCPANQVYRRGSCVCPDDVPNWDGSKCVACLDDGDCDLCSDCLSGKCVSIDCGDKTCDPSDGDCKDCVSDDDCGEDQVCKDGKCDCREGYVRDRETGECVKKPSKPCRNNNDCPNCESCKGINSNTGYGSCSPVVCPNEGEVPVVVDDGCVCRRECGCDSGNGCGRYEYCSRVNNFLCVCESCPDVECDSNNECGKLSGNFCACDGNNNCAGKSCTGKCNTLSDCGEGCFCDNNGDCQTNPCPRTSCNSDSDCGQGCKCSGVCVPSDDGDGGGGDGGGEGNPCQSGLSLEKIEEGTDCDLLGQLSIGCCPCAVLSVSDEVAISGTSITTNAVFTKGGNRLSDSSQDNIAGNEEFTAGNVFYEVQYLVDEYENVNGSFQKIGTSEEFGASSLGSNLSGVDFSTASISIPYAIGTIVTNGNRRFIYRQVAVIARLEAARVGGSDCNYPTQNLYIVVFDADGVKTGSKSVSGEGCANPMFIWSRDGSRIRKLYIPGSGPYVDSLRGPNAISPDDVYPMPADMGELESCSSYTLEVFCGCDASASQEALFCKTVEEFSATSDDPCGKKIRVNVNPTCDINENLRFVLTTDIGQIWSGIGRNVSQASGTYEDDRGYKWVRLEMFCAKGSVACTNQIDIVADEAPVAPTLTTVCKDGEQGILSVSVSLNDAMSLFLGGEDVSGGFDVSSSETSLMFLVKYECEEENITLSIPSAPACEPDNPDEPDDSTGQDCDLNINPPSCVQSFVGGTFRVTGGDPTQTCSCAGASIGIEWREKFSDLGVLEGYFVRPQVNIGGEAEAVFGSDIIEQIRVTITVSDPSVNALGLEFTGNNFNEGFIPKAALYKMRYVVETGDGCVYSNESGSAYPFTLPTSARVPLKVTGTGNALPEVVWKVNGSIVDRGYLRDGGHSLDASIASGLNIRSVLTYEVVCRGCGSDKGRVDFCGAGCVLLEARRESCSNVTGDGVVTVVGTNRLPFEVQVSVGGSIGSSSPTIPARVQNAVIATPSFKEAATVVLTEPVCGLTVNRSFECEIDPCLTKPACNGSNTDCCCGDNYYANGIICGANQRLGANCSCQNINPCEGRPNCNGSNTNCCCGGNYYANGIQCSSGETLNSSCNCVSSDPCDGVPTCSNSTRNTPCCCRGSYRGSGTGCSSSETWSGVTCRCNDSDPCAGKAECTGRNTDCCCNGVYRGSTLLCGNMEIFDEQGCVCQEDTFENPGCCCYVDGTCASASSASTCPDRTSSLDRFLAGQNCTSDCSGCQ